MQSLVFCLIMLVHRVIAVVHHPLGQHQQQQQSWPAIIASSSFNGGEDVDRSHQAALPSSVNRLERSLFSGESSCSEPSEISENTIIRTKDSRALGARFLNETSLGSDARDRCMALCCSFHGCNVAVYEEKDGGNCYLFDCGPAEDFRCKFTSHSHYTSGVIRRRESAHEEELTQLKKMPGVNAVVTTLPTPATKMMATIPPAPAVSSTAKPARQCSRYQFECHTTGECIAIYNACDGIVQCSDGSDEAPELGCPATTTEATTTTKMTTKPVVHQHVKPPPIDLADIPAMSAQQQQHPLSPPNDWRANRGDRDRFIGSDPINSNQDGMSRWRTGAERDRMRGSYQPMSSGDGAGVYLSPPGAEPDRSINPYYNPDTNHRYGTSYGRDQEVITGNEYRSGDFYGDRYANINYDKDIRLPPSPYDAGVYSGGRKHDWDRNNNVIVNSIPGPLPAEIPQRNNNPQRIQPPSSGSEAVRSQPQDALRGVPTPPEVKAKPVEHTTVNAPRVTEPSTTPAPVKAKPPSLVTKDDVGPNHAHVNHFHVNQANYQEERAERSRQTVGAVWALTLGLSVTAVLVLLVGCRLRSLKSRLRRGRAGHARDADYLVNGMYL